MDRGGDGRKAVLGTPRPGRVLPALGCSPCRELGLDLVAAISSHLAVPSSVARVQGARAL